MGLSSLPPICTKSLNLIFFLFDGTYTEIPRISGYMSKLFLHPKIAENNSDNLLGKVVSYQGHGCGGGVHAAEGEHHPHSHRLLVGVLPL